MKKIELSTRDARKMYGKDKVMDELLLANFTKEELTESKLPESWEEYCKMNNIDDSLGALEYSSEYSNTFSPKFRVKQYVERKLYLLMKEYNGDWVADWNNDNEFKYVIRRVKNNIGCCVFCTRYNFLAFPTEELRDKFLNNFRDLIEIYFEL